MGSFSIVHWLIVLVVVVLIFGTKKLTNALPDLGKAIKGFKEGLKGEEDKPTASTSTPIATPQQVADKGTVDVDAKEKMKQ